MTTAWRHGLELIRDGDYWEAHEKLEQVWHATDEGPARDATQALIQCAAAAYKIEQAREGRAAENMQRGMDKLIRRALTLIDGASAEGVGWDVEALEHALGDLDAVRVDWRDGGTIAAAAQAAREVATRLADALDGECATDAT